MSAARVHDLLGRALLAERYGTLPLLYTEASPLRPWTLAEQAGHAATLARATDGEMADG